MFCLRQREDAASLSESEVTWFGLGMTKWFLHCFLSLNSWCPVLYIIFLTFLRTEVNTNTLFKRKLEGLFPVILPIITILNLKNFHTVPLTLLTYFSCLLKKTYQRVIISFLKASETTVLWNVIPFWLYKIIWYKCHILCNTPVESGQYPQSNTLIFLRWYIQIFTVSGVKTTNNLTLI